MTYKPKMEGAVFLKTKALTRARQKIGGGFFRSKGMGVEQNLISIEVKYNQSDLKAVLGVMNNDTKTFKSSGFSKINVRKLNILFDEIIKIELVGEIYVVNVYRKVYLLNNSLLYLRSFGEIKKNVLFYSTDLIIDADWSGVPVLEKQVEIYNLVKQGLVNELKYSVTNLRGMVNLSKLIEMPIKGADVAYPSGVGTEELVPFGKVNLSGGDGLPISPSGFNTGPERTMIHLNYGEDNTGRMVILNRIYHWVGDDELNGKWVE